MGGNASKNQPRTRHLGDQDGPARGLGQGNRAPEIEIEREIEMQEMRERKPMRTLG